MPWRSKARLCNHFGRVIALACYVNLQIFTSVGGNAMQNFSFEGGHSSFAPLHVSACLNSKIIKNGSTELLFVFNLLNFFKSSRKLMVINVYFLIASIYPFL